MERAMKKVNKIKSAKKTSTGQKKGRKPLKENVNRGIKKQYLKSDKSCSVTFRLPKESAPDAQVVTIVGDFNNWNVKETLMNKLKSGDFKLILKLPCAREYRFRYLIDSNRWENDWCADKYVPNAFGCDDSVVII
jgi:1,4-alpha-glucan branching enzyme